MPRIGGDVTLLFPANESNVYILFALNGSELFPFLVLFSRPNSPCSLAMATPDHQPSICCLARVSHRGKGQILPSSLKLLPSLLNNLKSNP